LNEARKEKLLLSNKRNTFPHFLSVLQMKTAQKFQGGIIIKRIINIPNMKPII
jgi:hypothetical protein